MYTSARNKYTCYNSMTVFFQPIGAAPNSAVQLTSQFFSVLP